MLLGPIAKTRWPPWPLIGWDIFDFFSKIAERNSTKLDRKQTLNVLYQVCVFRADLKNKVAALASDWLRNVRLLWWNRWTAFKEHWQESRSQCPPPSLCFSGWSERQDGRPGLWLAEIFSTSSLKPLNGIHRNLTAKRISMSSTKFVFFVPIAKIRWSLWPLIGWDIFDFFSETAERNSTKLDRKEDRNVLYQVCVFRADRKNKMAALPLIGWDIFDFFSETAERNSTKLDRNQDLNVFYQVCVFRLIGKTRWPPQPLIGWDISDFSDETAWQEAKSQRPLSSLCFSGRSVKKKRKMAAMAHDWLRHFLLLLWNCWTGFKEIWQEARSQHFLPRCFSVWWVNKNYRPGRSVKKVAHCTQVHDMWPFGPLVYVFI